MLKECYENLDDFEIINQIDDFYLAKHKGNEGACVIYAYDGGYQYHVVSLEKLLDFDTEAFFAKWLDSIGKYITSQRPYSNKFNFGGDDHEIL